MPNTGTITGLTPSTEYALDTVHVDAWGNVSAVVSSAAFTTEAAPVGGVATHITTALGDTVVEEFTTTVDVSGHSAGEKLIVGYNGLNHPTSVTVNGNSAGSQVITVTGGTGRKSGIYEYTLLAGDISTGVITIAATPPSSSIGHVIDVWHSTGSIASNAGGDSFFDGTSFAVTPTQATNAVIAWHAGGDLLALDANGFAYTAGGLTRTHFAASEVKAATGGILDNAATSELTITWTDDGPDGYASIVFVVE
jgi:hypothetical protein